MSGVRVIALGSEMGSDDGAALRAGERLRAEGFDVLLAARPGPGLVDLLEPSTPTVLLDVVRRGAAPGKVVEVPLGRLAHVVAAGDPVSSHGLGMGDALRLAAALGRPLPAGVFLGLGGARFSPGADLSPEVRAAMDAWIEAARRAVARLSEEA